MNVMKPNWNLWRDKVHLFTEEPINFNFITISLHSVSNKLTIQLYSANCHFVSNILISTHIYPNTCMCLQ